MERLKRVILSCSLGVFALGGAWASPGETVHARGDTFWRRGRPYMYAGTNNYYVGIDNATPGGEPDLAVMDELLADYRALGLEVIRIWGFNDHDTTTVPGQTAPDPNRLQTKVGSTIFRRDGTGGAGVDDGVDYFRALDTFIARCADNDMHVILPVTNNWYHYGGMAQYVQWATGSPAPDPSADMSAWRHYKNGFYRNPTAQSLYRDYVAYLANRVNTVSGRTYKDDPTILCWQLANEPECETYAGGSHALLDDWVADTSDWLKNTVGVSQHVTVGMEGFYDSASENRAAGGTPSWFASQGTDFITNHDHAAIDIAGFHMYQQPWGMTTDGAQKWIADHIRRGRMELDRPVLFNEVGYLYDRSGDPAAEDERIAHYKMYFETAYRNKVSGVNFWTLYHDAYPDYDNYGVYYPADAETADTIARFSGKMRLFNHTGIHQLTAFEYDLDGFERVTHGGVSAIERVEDSGWAPAGDGAARVAFELGAGEKFMVGAPMIDDLSGEAGFDVSTFGYKNLVARIMVEDNATFEPGDLYVKLYDFSGGGTYAAGGGQDILEAGRWIELAWDSGAAGDLSTLEEIGIDVWANDHYDGAIRVEFIGGDVTDLRDNAAIAYLPLGDFTADGALNGLDIPEFKQALADAAAWRSMTGRDANYFGDFSGDGVMNGLDIPGFKTALAGATIPEPMTAILVTAALAAAMRRRG